MNGPAATRRLRVHILRYNPAEPAKAARFQTYEVDEAEGMTLFILLSELREKQDPSLQFDFVCSILDKTSEKISSKRLEEMRKHFPELWDEIDNFRTKMMFGNITRVIDQGKAEGLFIDYPTPIIMKMLVSSVRAIVNPEFILNNNFSIGEAALFAFKVIIVGILLQKKVERFLVKQLIRCNYEKNIIKYRSTFSFNINLL